jgi:DNA-binding CsgD family transcriptional regulator
LPARDRVLAEAAGNPLALIELPGLLAGADEAEDAASGSVPNRIEQLYRSVVGALPQRARDLLLVAATDDSGELGPVLRAAQAFGASADDLAVAEQAQLVRLTPTRIAFRHPLIRAAAYHGAPVTTRWAAHRALAEAIGDTDPERRTQHLAAVSTGPDEVIAAELDRSARSAHDRGGLASALAAYERAAELSEDQALQVERLALAAEVADELGNHIRATGLIDRAEPLALDPLIRARLATVRGHASYAGSELVQAHRYLYSAATLLQDSHPQEALWLLVEMARIARATGVDTVAVDTAELLDSLPLPAADPLLPVRDVVRWLLYRQIGRDPAGLPALPDTASAALQIGAGGLRGRLFTANACLVAGDSPQMYAAADALVATIRAQGAVGLMSEALIHQAEMQMYRGQLREARATASEAARIAEDIGQHNWVSLANSVLAVIAALEGNEDACRSHAGIALRGPEVTAPGSVGANWALGLLDLGLGRMESAVARLEPLGHGPTRFQLRVLRSAPDLLEAAVRAAEPECAAEALSRVAAWAGQIQRPWVDALLLRCKALLAPDDDAEHYYNAALERHETDRPFEVARTMLLYGEWLRRVRRRLTDARIQLRAALDIFERLGTHPWADRARRELRAAGESVATDARIPDGFDRLTPQELQIVRLAAAGLSNRAIGAQLFLSPRTIGYHLYKAYPKLGVASRGELARLSSFNNGASEGT